MIEPADYYLDITADLCPMTFVRTKLLVERMKSGEVAEIRLKGHEPLVNVPRSLAELGHAVESCTVEPGEPADGVHRMRIRKA